MKTFSDTAITKTDLDAVDAKQTRQIKQLRFAVGVGFLLNAIFTSILFMLK